jgi:AhpD family alkylhydroperoxidase
MHDLPRTKEAPDENRFHNHRSCDVVDGRTIRRGARARRTQLHEAGIPRAGRGFSLERVPSGDGCRTALEPKIKERIALEVAAQVPCHYCIYYHTQAAKAQGATPAESNEALSSAALVRKWSTMLNGSEYDREQWRKEVDAMFAPKDSAAAN